MSNMSYCRFQNTERDLDDCKRALENGDFPEKESEHPQDNDSREFRAMVRLIRTCREIVELVDRGDTSLDKEEMKKVR